MSDLEQCFGLRRRRSAHGRGGERAYLAHEDCYLRKYRHWRGRSGRSYAFSVYAAEDCPAYENAVLILANSAGRIVACVDLGASPAARLIELRRQYRDRLAALDFQIHVLAERPGDRLSLIDDIIPRAA
jgi:hypothetical protein